MFLYHECTPSMLEHTQVDRHSDYNKRTAGHSPADHVARSRSNNDNWVHALMYID
jgi:hypothetical protein